MYSSRKNLSPKFFLIDILSKKDVDNIINILHLKNIKHSNTNELVLTKYFFEKELLKLKQILSEKDFILFLNSISHMDCIVNVQGKQTN